jgi:alkyl hydroperoxide reductase subunit AhpC
MKFNQLWVVFIYDFVAKTKVCQGEIYEFYTNLNMKFNKMDLNLISVCCVLNTIQ